MHAEDRLIHFSTELLHPPAQPKVPALQKLYYELSKTRAAYQGSDFTAPNQSRFYSRRGKKTQSIALFLPDRVVLVEEWADMALADFLEKAREVALGVFSELDVRAFVAQTATLRSTFSLTHFADSRQFLIDHACGQADRVGVHFCRPISVGGLRFILPETPEHRGTLHVIIESFPHDVKEVFVEVKGLYGRQQIGPDSVAAIAGNIQHARSFITDHVFPYLNQYDVPQEESYEL